MNRISREMGKLMYVMDLEEHNTEQSRRDWKDLMMFNDIECAIRKQKNVEVA